ncbi:MAG: hypothetical protein QNJ33_08015 [Crocosphaera sp.]|nr:hypothetical protein [Crocosphaera sp.]
MSSEKPSPLSSNLPDLSLSSTDEISQEELISLIKNTITKLDLILNKINDEKIKNLPKQESLNALINSTEMIANSLETESQTDDLAEESIENEKIDNLEEWEDDLTSTEANNTEPIKEAVKEIEALNLPEKRDSGSPLSILKNLSGRARAGILGLLIIIILSTSFFLFKPALPNLEIFNRSLETSQPQVVETPPQIEVPELPQPIKNVPSSQPKLTPEQSLIAAIQKEVTELTNQYPDDLIGRIEANFIGSRLIVTVGNQWYNLTTKEQDKLANNILERSQSLDFRKLEILDSQGNLIARTPVVGDEIIILQRQQ